MSPDREAAYVEFVTARRAQLRRLAYGLSGDWHHADDVVQTALVKLYVAWPRVVGEGAEDAYARRIVVRACIDESRRPWRREVPADVLPEQNATTPLGIEDREALLAAVRALPQMQRATVLLRHWLGLTVAETAADLGIGDGTVKSHTSRALAALAPLLADPETSRR